MIFKRAFVTVEAAVTLGLYITILGTIMLTGIHFYEESETLAGQKEALLDVKSLCDRQRAEEFLKDRLGV